MSILFCPVIKTGGVGGVSASLQGSILGPVPRRVLKSCNAQGRIEGRYGLMLLARPGPDTQTYLLYSHNTQVVLSGLVRLALVSSLSTLSSGYLVMRRMRILSCCSAQRLTALATKRHRLPEDPVKKWKAAQVSAQHKGRGPLWLCCVLKLICGLRRRASHKR